MHHFNRTLAAGIAALIAVILGSPSTLETSAAAPSGVRLEALLVDALGERVGGIAVLSIHDRETTEVAVGTANAAGDPIVADPPFRIVDIPQLFVAAMVMQFAEEGLVDLDEPLATYLPGTPLGGEVLVRQLLNHFSGLPRLDSRPALRADALADRDHVFTPSEVISYVEDAPTAPAGAFQDDSRANYNLLGQLIEEVTGTDLNNALQQRINEPLGLHVTSIDTGATPTPDGLAAGWSPTRTVNGDPTEPYASIASMLWPNVAFSTTHEIATILRGLFDGRLVSANSLAEMTTLGPGLYGLGIAGFTSPGGTQMYGAAGGTDGYSGIALYEPASCDTLVVLSNNDHVDSVAVGLRIIEELWLEGDAGSATAA
jgi:D-alanyl-D-alanine carboxypeptidase